MRRAALALAAMAVLLLAGCQKREGDAIVVSKEYVAAAVSPAPNEPTPATEPAAGDTPRQLRGEISADGHVMKPELRGTGRDPRALQEEQWRVTVRMVADARTFVVQAQRAQFDNVQDGDRVRVRYRSGKYTDTVWSAEIVR